MARPRVFISSTYYDLKSVRSDLEHFIRDLGSDPVMHERGAVAYGKTEALERYCYREIETCDVLISIVGGRLGSISVDSDYSISQMELKTAYDLSKSVYIFVERNVYHDYNTFSLNRSAPLKYASVDDPKIFHFIDELYKLPNNNPVHPFETSFDITDFLRDQWAGLFQRLLSHSTSDAHHSIFLELKQTLDTAKNLSELISSRADRNDEKAAELILTNHHFIADIRKKMTVSYRFIVSDLAEFRTWMRARGYVETEQVYIDGELHWTREDSKAGIVQNVKVSSEVFGEDGRLLPSTSSSWNDSNVEFSVKKKVRPRPAAFDDDLNDDVPF